MKVYAPKSYWNASPEEIAETCNGCGAEGGIKVPDSMWGLDIKHCCQIHDWMFKYGITYADFVFANAVFIMNLTITIIARSNRGIALLRLARATKYFLAVQTLGEDAYWKNKQRNETMTITYTGEFR